MEKNGGLSRKEQIERDLQTIARLQNRVKQNRAKEKERERKERTKRLIEIGALVEKYAGKVSNFERFEEYLKQYGGYIRKNQAAE